MKENDSAPARPSTLAELEALVGVVLGPTQWHLVTQVDVDAFADATGDHQWIHIDADRAAASGLGGTIAHGLYSLSLGPVFTHALLSFDAFAHSLNYGYDRVRFPAPLPVGTRVRMYLDVAEVRRVSQGVQLRLVQRFEREGGGKPVAVAEALALVVPEDLHSGEMNPPSRRDEE